VRQEVCPVGRAGEPDVVVRSGVRVLMAAPRWVMVL
jgi:hypothetical protein